MTRELKWEKFVRRVTLSKEGYTRLSLVQVMAGGGLNTLRYIDLNSEFGYDGEKIAQIVAEFFCTAQEDADGHRGLTSYALKAIKGATVGERSPVIRLRRQSDEDGEDDILGESEEPTLAGVTSQLMRHNEAQARTISQMFEVMVTQSSARDARQTAQLQHYEERHWENILQREELLSEKDSRDIARAESLSRGKRLDETIKMLKPLVPAALSKLKGLPPGAKAGAQMDVLKAIMKNVTPDQMEKIAEVLGNQALGLVELYLDAKREEEPEEFKEEAKH